MPAADKKCLLVEGHDDLYAIVQLMAQHVEWGDKKSDWPVTIEVCGGVDALLQEEFLPVKLKSREVEILGIVIDANDSFAHRWHRLRYLCFPAFPAMPADCPGAGLICDNANEGKRLGIWIMPDNRSRGMLESFMQSLVPPSEQAVWKAAVAATEKGTAAGAKFKKVHQDKASIYTWLAWQDPPGQSIGTALVKNMLDVHAAHAAAFTAWFRALFHL